jgi:Arc/MetJ-type ribon-helix-helix transcriptional regulator
VAETKTTVRLNQQQWELVDKTIERGEAASREALFRTALREFWREHFADEKPKSTP